MRFKEGDMVRVVDNIPALNAVSIFLKDYNDLIGSVFLIELFSICQHNTVYAHGHPDGWLLPFEALELV